MQSGLMTTYQNPTQNRNGLAWGLSALLMAFYVDLYFTDHLDTVASALHLPSKWTFYGLIYTLAMCIGGWFMLRKHGNSAYHRWRTISLVAVQSVLGFLLPLVLDFLGRPSYYFSYFFPLKYDILFPGTLKDMPVAVACWFVFGSLVGVPTLVYFQGKRAYCSWICGCGGLAETFGDPWRHLSDRSDRAWRIEQVSIYTVLALVLVMLGLVVGDAYAADGSAIRDLAGHTKSFYGFAIGSVFSGVLGTGLYPLMGSRFWCRFGCPMAAILGLIQKFGQFRITVKKDMCISCGNCSAYCEMGIDVRAYAMAGTDIRRASCVGCGLCAHVCPRGVLKLETRAALGPHGKIEVWTLDL
ncbi:MAG: 4Fe-4S binding protein [Myxococcales bacterium]|nr:4Fe-4S binding protein [Myxococcales bacterium]